MITYEQRKMQLAEKMARQDTGALFAPDVIPAYLGLAELSLQDTAEVAMHALSHGYHVKCDEIKGQTSRGYGGKYLQSQGLVPQK